MGPPNEPRGAAEWSRKASPAPGWGVTGSHFCHMPHGSARFLPSEGTRPLPPRPRVGLTSREEQAVRGRVGDTPSPHGPLSQPGQHAGVFPIHTVAQATTSAPSSRWPATQVRPWWGALGHLGDLGSPCGKPPGPQGPWTSWQEQRPLGRRDGQATRPPLPNCLIPQRALINGEIGRLSPGRPRGGPLCPCRDAAGLYRAVLPQIARDRLTSPALRGCRGDASPDGDKGPSRSSRAAVIRLTNRFKEHGGGCWRLGVLAAGGAGGRGCWSATQSIRLFQETIFWHIPRGLADSIIPASIARPAGMASLPRRPRSGLTGGLSHLVQTQHLRGPGRNENSEALVQSYGDFHDRDRASGQCVGPSESRHCEASYSRSCPGHRTG